MSLKTRLGMLVVDAWGHLGGGSLPRKCQTRPIVRAPRVRSNASMV